MSILTFLQNIVVAAEKVTGPTLGDDGQKVVDDAVAVAQDLTGADGAAKLSSAVSKAGTDLAQLGKDVPLYLLHLAIEASAAKLNLLEAGSEPDTAGEDSGAGDNAGAGEEVKA